MVKYFFMTLGLVSGLALGASAVLADTTLNVPISALLEKGE